MKIALITCSKSKQNYPCAAAEMYKPSTLFSLSYAYAKKVADKVFILSSRYGLLEEDDRIEPYELDLNDLPYNRRVDWANYVLEKLRTKCDVEMDEFIILAGRAYYENILPALKKYSLPLGRLSMGERKSTLQSWLQDGQKKSNSYVELREVQDNAPISYCMELHRIFNRAKRYDSSNISDVPFENGIYVMFEKGKSYHNFGRIVRVGTHTSPNRLKNRLMDHF